MKDYSFGNFICGLRVRRGLSQFQLGTLVGVSNKAVSKWENGSSKPRMSVCIRLAEVLGVTVDELLACKYQPASKAENGVFAMKTSIWKALEAKLISLYGENPSARIIARFESERRLMKNGDLLIHFDALARISELSRASGKYSWIRGDINNSYIAWLMGATNVNPLEPHYYCPICKTIEFITDAKDGWDLPDRTCICGHHLKKDGHKLPFERTLFTLENRKCFDICLPRELLPEADHLLHEFYKDKGKAIKFNMENENPDALTRYIIVDSETELPSTPMGRKEYYQKYSSQPQFIFTFPLKLRELTELCSVTNRTPTLIDFLSQDVLDAYRNVDLPKTGEYELKPLQPILSLVKPSCFSDIVRTDGLQHATDVWENNQQILYENGEISLDEMLVFREDIYELISATTKAFSNSGTGLEIKIMEKVFKGHYALHGMPETEEHLLKDIGISKQHIDIMKKILYMFPRGHCIAALQMEMILVWFWIHHRKEYLEIHERCYQDV